MQSERKRVLWEKRQREKRATEKRRFNLQLSKNRYNETINSYLTDFIEDSKAKFEARREEEEKERARLKKAREERSLTKTIERTGWIKDFVKQLVGVALIVVKNMNTMLVWARAVISAKDWRILRFDIRNKLPRDQLLGIDEAMMGGMDITTEHQLDIADYNDFTASTREWRRLSTEAGR